MKNSNYSVQKYVITGISRFNDDCRTFRHTVVIGEKYE